LGIAIGHAAPLDAPSRDEALGVYCWGDLCLAVVCDGSGPHGAGEQGAALVIRTLVEVLQDGPADLAAALTEGLKLSNRLLFDGGRSRPAAAGSSVRAVAIALRGDTAVVAHVGDARALIVRGADVQWLTRDHTLEAGPRSAVLAAIDGLGGAVDAAAPTRALGRERIVVANVRASVPLYVGDVIVLATAGAHHGLADAALVSAASADPPTFAATLRDRAATPGRGGAVVVLRVGADGVASQGPTEVPEVERSGDLLTPSTADLRLVGRLTDGSPSTTSSLDLPFDPPRGMPRPAPPSPEPEGPERARQGALVGLMIGLMVIAVLLLASLVLG
jgi:PPM family protein phosphatase